MKQQIIDNPGDFMLLFTYLFIVLVLAGILYLAVWVDYIKRYGKRNNGAINETPSSDLTTISLHQNAGHDQPVPEQLALVS